MPPRLQVSSGLRPVPLRPTATPVDTFVPDDGGGQELAQLARSLKDFGVSAGRFAGVVDEKESKKQTARGEQTARELEEKRITYREAVKQGLIKTSDNPWFLLGAKQQFGRASAGQYARALQAAIETDPAMQVSTEPGDFDKFEQSFRKQWLEENVGKDNRDAQFEHGFKIVDGYTMDEGRRFIAAAGARVEKLAGERLGTIIGQVLDQHYADGSAPALINAELGAYLADNPKGGRVANLRAVQSIEDWARLNYKTVGREDIEKVLRSVDAGPGSKLFGTHEAKEMTNRVEKEIISMRGAAAAMAHNEEVRVQLQAEKTFWSDVTLTLVDSQKSGTLSSLDLTSYIRKLNTIDPSPDAPAKLFRLRDALKDAKGNDDSYRSGLMWAHGVNPDRPGSLMSLSQLASYAATEGLTGAQYGSIANEIQQREQNAANGSSGSDLLGNRMYAAGEQFIKGQMVDLWGTNTQQNRTASEAAIRDFTQDYLEHRKDIADLKDPGKQNEYIQKLAENALKLHAPSEVQRALNKEQSTTEQNKQAQTVYQAAIKNATDADLTALGTAWIEWKDGRKSESTGRLMQRLGVPLDDKQIKLFFLEWERNH